METKVFRLDGEHAAEWSPLGLKIFAYFIDDEVIHQDVSGGSVILGEFAQAEVVNAICESTTQQHCDQYSDLALEGDRLRKALAAAQERLRANAQTLSNVVSSETMSDDCRTILDNEWTNVLSALAVINTGEEDANA